MCVMKKLLVLGTGCPKCTHLAEQVAAAATAIGLEYSLEKVTAIDQIMRHGVMMTPALVVDGTVKVVGRVPSLDELKRILAA